MLTSEAKKLLAETIRGSAQDPGKGLRERLLVAIADEAERRYRLAVPIAEAKLAEAPRRRRERLAAWLDERARTTRPKNAKEHAAAEQRFLRQAVKEAAATFLNRLVLLRQLEALGLSKPAVLTGGWSSKGYREFREFAPGLVKNDETEGFATLLGLVFDELAIDLPGLFGDVGLTGLFPIPAAALKECVERLDAPGLASAWTDDTTLGWVYQYWNDPDREALDAKINGGGKIEPHEIASKTQMFTERYMVEWLLQNSLGLTWLAICKKHGWTPDAERVLGPLDARRADWRKKREAGEVALDALMPIEGELEEDWKYFVPQPIPEDAVTNAPESLRALKLLDPACGSGHFLVIAFGMLARLYEEEARHTGKAMTPAEIAEAILEHNLHGIDIDPRAIQIAAAALYLKAKGFAKGARLRKVNLVAPVLGLGKLPADDPAVVRLRAELARAAAIPAALTDSLLGALAGVDYLGSLFKVDRAIDDAIAANVAGARPGAQLSFGGPGGAAPTRRKGESGELRLALTEKLEHFLGAHANAEDLGLRLDGEQLAAGVRFLRMAREGAYDLVVGNPPYQGLSKTASFEYVAKMYPKGKADLYAAFLERAQQLLRRAGASALVTMRGWMFLNQFRELREQLLRESDLVSLVDLDSGAFDEVSAAQVVLSVACSVFLRSPPDSHSTALRPTPTEDKASTGMTNRKRAGLLAQVGRYEFDARGFEVIEGEPIVYWWSRELLAEYRASEKLGKAAPVRQGMATTDNTRFVRKPWEIHNNKLLTRLYDRDDARPLVTGAKHEWVPYIKGAAGACWFESLDDCVLWRSNGLAVKLFNELRYGSYSRNVKNAEFYFRRGIAFSMIGNSFQARAHRFTSIIGHMGSSAFPSQVAPTLCLMNSERARFILDSLNPGVHYEVGDVNRLPIHVIDNSDKIVEALESEFAQLERSREGSVEFRAPIGSAWESAKDWARDLIDRPSNTSFLALRRVVIAPTAVELVSFAIGVTLRRFDRHGAGILTPSPDERGTDSILFIGPDNALSMHPLGAFLVDTWAEHGAEVGGGDDLGTYLRKSFFDYHKKLYENRPIYFPLSSAKKSFVAYCGIHRWEDDTLSVLLADHLVPARRKLEGELEDLRAARAAATGGAKGKSEKRFVEVQKLLEELQDFIAKVAEIAEKGPPPVDDKTPKREVDAKFHMDLDDGVMVNSAALWPLLEPQWRDPKKWWKELATASGKKDYDWSHLAARYFPSRVRKKCEADPSLGVAHRCFWELHPAKAYAWELRLQDEIRPDFTIDEPGSDEARASFLAEHAAEAAAIAEKEQARRAKKAAKANAGAPDEDEDGGASDMARDDEEAEASDD